MGIPLIRPPFACLVTYLLSIFPIYLSKFLIASFLLLTNGDPELKILSYFLERAFKVCLRVSTIPNFLISLNFTSLPAIGPSLVTPLVLLIPAFSN